MRLEQDFTDSSLTERVTMVPVPTRARSMAAMNVNTIRPSASIGKILDVVIESIAEGLSERKQEKDKNDTEEAPSTGTPNTGGTRGRRNRSTTAPQS
jgi:hypothetical protein